MNVKKNLLIKILLCLVEDSLVSTCDDDSTNDTIVKMATILVKIRTVVSTIMMLKWSWRGCISFSHSFILKINLFGEKIANHFSIQPLSCIATGSALWWGPHLDLAQLLSPRKSRLYIEVATWGCPPHFPRRSCTMHFFNLTTLLIGLCMVSCVVSIQTHASKRKDRRAKGFIERHENNMSF